MSPLQTTRLQTELQRLYFSCDADAQVRGMVLEVAGPSQWDRLCAVWQGVQADLALPAPAIAVSGVDGHQLWFSLAEPVAVAQALDFLEALRMRYLGDVALERVRMQPAMPASAPGQEQQDGGRWSAFVLPGLAPMFADEPWLDIPPNPDAQADLLSRFKSTTPAEFQRALEQLRPIARPENQPAPGVANTALSVVGPQQFLLDVMNDASVELHLRIDAAKALLPYLQQPHRT